MNSAIPVLSILASSALTLFPSQPQGSASTEQLHLIGQFEPEPLYRQGKLTDPNLEGAWRRVGYGDYFLIGSEQVRVYATCSAGCWELPEEAGTELFVYSGSDRDSCLVTTHPLEVPYRLERMAAAPQDCLAPRDWSKVEIFDLFESTLSEHYPFFEQREFDWVTRAEDARRGLRAGLDERSLFELMDRSLAGLGDGHVFLQAEIAGEWVESESAWPRAVERLELLLDPELTGDAREAQFEESKGELFGSIRRGVFLDLLGGDADGSDMHATGWIEGADRIGYLGYIAMMDESYDDLGELVQAVHDSVDEALRNLEGMRALVLDVSLNGGGTDAVSHAIASHFVAERRLAYTKGPASRPELRYGFEVIPSKTSSYTGPIFLVTSDFTASAAEVFALCLKDEEHVTLVGEQSGGAYSDILSKTLPNGWEFGISIESYEDTAGVCYEGLGVPVDVEVPIFSGEDLFNSHRDGLRLVVELADEIAASSSGE